MPHVSAFARGARSVESSSPSRCMPQEFGHAAMRVFVLPLVVSYSQTKSTSFIIEFAVRMVALYTLFRPTRPAAPLRHVASNQQICAGSIPHAVSCGHSLCPPSLASRPASSRASWRTGEHSTTRGAPRSRSCSCRGRTLSGASTFASGARAADVDVCSCSRHGIVRREVKRCPARRSTR